MFIPCVTTQTCSTPNHPPPPPKHTTGRRDATSADPGDRLPPESLSTAGQLAVFASMGLSPTGMVALLGSHTLGGKGFGDPLTFDATYYRTLLQKPWNDPKVEMSSMIGIPTDRVLPDDPVCRPIIERFAQDEAAFFQEFVKAYVYLCTVNHQET